MKKSLLCLALALVAALAVPSFAAITTTAQGNPINTTLTIPQAAGTMNCANVALTTFTATAVLAAQTGAIRQGLYIINTSTIPMSAGSRIPDLVWSSSSAPTIVSASNFARMPGVILHSGVNPSGGATQAVNANHSMRLEGSGVPSGAIYAVAESTGASVDVKASATACEWY